MTMNFPDTMLSSVFFPDVKRRCLASFTLSKPQALQYIRIKKRSSFCIWSDSMLKKLGSLDNATSVSVNPGVLSQAAQAVFFPQPRKCDTVSHPVMAWKSGNARDFDGPIWAHTSWMGISRTFFPLPRHTHNSVRFSVKKKRTKRTTTSLSTVRTTAFRWPCCAA